VGSTPTAPTILGIMMNKHSDPLDYVLSCCEQGLLPELFCVQNAKDELQKLRKEINSFKIVAYGRVNDRLDLYGVNINHNPYLNQDTIVPLYSNKQEFLKEDWKGYSYGLSAK
jgi:hypothetical protein